MRPNPHEGEATGGINSASGGREGIIPSRTLPDGKAGKGPEAFPALAPIRRPFPPCIPFQGVRGE